MTAEHLTAPSVPRVRESSWQQKLKLLGASGHFVMPLSAERLQEAHFINAEASTCGIGVAKTEAVPIETLAMYFLQVFFNRVFGIPRAFVVVANHIASSCGTGGSTEAITREQLAIGANVARWFTDVRIDVITDHEVVKRPAYRQALREGAECLQREEKLRGVRKPYSFLQDVLFTTMQRTMGVVAKGGYAFHSDEDGCTCDKALSRLFLKGNQGDSDGAAEDVFDSLTMSTFQPELSFFYQKPALAFDSDRQTGRLYGTDCGERARVLLRRGFDPLTVWPNLSRPPKRVVVEGDAASGSRRKNERSRERRWQKRMIDAIERLLSFVCLSHAVLPEGALPELDINQIAGAKLPRAIILGEMALQTIGNLTYNRLADQAHCQHLEEATVLTELLVPQLRALIQRFAVESV